MDLFKGSKFQKSESALSSFPSKQRSSINFATRPTTSKSYMTGIYELFQKTSKESDFDGRISVKHLKVILKTLDPDKEKYEISEIVSQLDPNREGFINFSDLCEIMITKNRDILSENDLRRAFRLMDKEEKGFLTLQDLKNIMNEVEEETSEELLQDMFDEADVQDLGVVTEDNFVQYMLKAQEDAHDCNCNGVDS